MTPAPPAAVGGTPAFPDGLPLVRPTIPDVPALTRRLGDVLASGMLTNGPLVRELEERVAERCGVPHVVAVASCTTGLMLTYQALGVTGRVLMPSFTFAASAHAVVWAGAEPLFAEVDADTMTLDPAAAVGLVGDAAAISATHVYGRPCEVEALEELAGRAGLPLVYDAAHALGSRRRGRPVGGFGTAEVFSLSPTKVAVAGEGGLVTTHDAALAEAVRLGRDYGNPGDYDCRFPGLNARMSELHAAVALASLDGLDERIAHRNDLVATFRAATAGLPGLSFQQVDDRDVSTYKDLTLVVDPERFGLDAASLGRALRLEGADTRRYYWPPIHRQQAYASVPLGRELPITDRLAARVLTPPLYSHMTTDQVERLADAVVRIQAHAGDPRLDAAVRQPAAIAS
ncbi:MULTISPECIES: DegT/DnrJ/EryC1/StrS family aminotransferase [unclassified Blastococcus]